MFRRSLFAVALLACYAVAAPVLTTIQDVLYKADGTRFNGTLTISCSSFQAADNSAIMMQTFTVRVIDGNVRVQLVPSATSTPPIVYSVTYNSNGRVQSQETWSVPASATPLRLGAVRVAVTSSATSGGTAGASTSYAILPDQIAAGGASAGQALVYTGAGWQPRGITLNRYAFPVSGTSVYIAAIYHGLGSNVALLGCQDAGGAVFQPGGIHVDSSGDVTVTAAVSMSGLCVLSGSPSGVGQYVASFTSATSITLIASTLGLGLTPTVPACYDGLGNWFEPGRIVVDSSGDVTIAFAVAQTGNCILQ